LRRSSYVDFEQCRAHAPDQSTISWLRAVRVFMMWPAENAPNIRGTRTYQNSGRDYSRRSGFPREPEAMRGAARKKPNQASRAAAAE
jgi:hypothetical protein